MQEDQPLDKSDHTERPTRTEPEVPVVFDQSGAGSCRDPQSGFQPAHLRAGAVAISDPAHLYPLAPGNVVKLAGGFQPYLRGKL